MQKSIFIIARILLGLMFAVFGLNGFVPFIPPPPAPLPPLAAQFFGAIMQSHFVYLVSGTQLACGVLLLLGRAVPFAVVTLAAVIANIWTFHLTMMPATIIPMPPIATGLWFITAWSVRDRLFALFR